jgi:hypothetical protein
VLLREAQSGGYAVGGFEPYTIDQIQAILEAAEEEQAPVILQLWAEVIETPLSVSLPGVPPCRSRCIWTTPSTTP